MKKKTIDYYMNLPYRLEIIPDIEEGGYAAYYPELPGCITCAETMEEVVILAQDAKKEWLTACIEDA
ncbi:MAG: type II toxin-antitoxin system HicB family antitoxin, partial [Lachnospiraceae bacterium]|nr:type II toxin-antitoxin system HicB family antitoxin [Lachnospiraceae bacterium]